MNASVWPPTCCDWRTRRFSLSFGNGVRVAIVISKGCFDKEGIFLFHPLHLLALFTLYRTHARFEFFAFHFRLALIRAAGAGSLFKVADVSTGCFMIHFTRHRLVKRRAIILFLTLCLSQAKSYFPLLDSVLDVR